MKARSGPCSHSPVQTYIWHLYCWSLLQVSQACMCAQSCWANLFKPESFTSAWKKLTILFLPSAKIILKDSDWLLNSSIKVNIVESVIDESVIVELKGLWLAEAVRWLGKSLGNPFAKYYGIDLFFILSTKRLLFHVFWGSINKNNIPIICSFSLINIRIFCPSGKRD